MEKKYLTAEQLWTIRNHVEVRYCGWLVQFDEFIDKENKSLIFFLQENTRHIIYNNQTAPAFRIEFINNL